MHLINEIDKTAFILEKRLKETNPALHKIYSSGIFAIDRLLMNYKTDFPFFTDHTFQHSAQLINYCNILVGEKNINRLNADEIYIILMGACLHDVGMGISRSDFAQFESNIPEIASWRKEHPDALFGDATRAFHNDLSAEFIAKYSELFEIPSAEYVYCIGQVARGHRKNNLMDASKFNPNYKLPNGNTVHLNYLAALLKLADELDITSERNLLFDYDSYETENKGSALAFKSHSAIKSLTLVGDKIIIHYNTDDEKVIDEINIISGKVQQTFKEYEDVVASTSDFEQIVNEIVFKDMRVTK